MFTIINESGGISVERGGPTTQSGILYQNSIAALYLGSLCDPRARDADRVVRVRVEAPDKVDDTVVEYADQRITYIQAKEAISPGEKAWIKLWEDFSQQFCEDSFIKGRDFLRLQNGEPSRQINNLKKLCLYAGESLDYDEWWKRLSNSQKSLVNSIDQNVGHLLLGKEQKRLFFAHIDVNTTSLEDIESLEYLRYWMPECNKGEKTLFRLLRDRVGGKGRIRGTFTPSALAKSLKNEDDIDFIQQADIVEVRSTIQRCSGLMRQTKRTIGRTGIHMDRPIINEMLIWAQETNMEQSVAVLLDQAGMGKTAVMGELLEELEHRDIDVLAIKADQQLSGIKNYSEIGKLLNLNDSIERIAARLATQGTVVVLIDQVDALSLSMAHDQSAINIILELVSGLRRIPGVRTMLSCRMFDYYNDPRIHSIEVGKKFELTEFSDDDVREVLKSVNIFIERLTPSACKLLKIPLHLNLFVMAIESSTAEDISNISDIASMQELYQMIWNNIVIKINPEAPPAHERVEVVMLMTEYMNKEQTISVRKSKFTTSKTHHLQYALKWLASSGILVDSKDRWSFFHQTFFDYCYARSLVEEGFSISSWLMDSDQGLFCRPQLIQVLSYLRGTENDKEYIKGRPKAYSFCL